MGFFSDLLEPVKSIAGDIGGAVNGMLDPVTPWNDNTNTGKLANIALMAYLGGAASYGSFNPAEWSMFGGTNTVASNNIFTGTGTAETASTGGGAIAGDAAAEVSGNVASAEVVANNLAAPVGMEGSTVTTGGGVYTPVDFTANASIGAGGAAYTPSVVSSGAASEGLFGGDALMKGMLGLSATNGVASYLTAQEQIDLQKEAMKPNVISDEALALTKPENKQRVGRISTGNNVSVRDDMAAREKRFNEDKDYRNGMLKTAAGIIGIPMAQLELALQSSPVQLASNNPMAGLFS